MMQRLPQLLRQISRRKAPTAFACAGLVALLSVPAQMTFGANAPLSTSSTTRIALDTETTQLAKLTLGDNARLLGSGKSAEELNAAIPLDTAAIEPMAAFSSLKPSSAGYGNALTCLSQAIYYEAANEPLEGKRAVAQVVLNRVRHPAYPHSVCGVVYEGWNAPVCQFSFVCDGSLRRTPMASKWRESQVIARDALAGKVETSVGTATHYHADYVVPRWAYTLAKVDGIGRHLFYRFPGRGGRANTFSAHWNGRESIPQIDFARFDNRPDDGELALAEAVAVPAVVRDPTDRRTDNDVGGRLDTSKGWQLAIPDPVNASAGYAATRREQLSADYPAAGGAIQ